MLGLQRCANGLALQFYRRVASYSTSIITAPEQGTSSDRVTSATANPSTPAEITDSTRKKSAMVAAAFQSLKDNADDIRKQSKLDNIDEKIINAKTVSKLLAVSESNGPISRRHALKIVSILAEWSSVNRVKLSEFENDSRFLKICRVLGRTVPKDAGTHNKSVNGKSVITNEKKTTSGFRTDDLNTVLGVAGDDEAAKLIASISLPQMVKVMSTLAQQKRRSTPLLRSLAFNISSTSEQLDLKKCADVLFAMSTLNFQDSVLAAKICADIHVGLTTNKEKSAVCGSILTSLGILKYRDLDIMEALTEWFLHNHDICRPQDVSALFLTSALLNFKSARSNEIQTQLVRSIVKEDFSKRVDWLNHVWAIAMLRFANNSHLESVLRAEFIEEITAEQKLLSPTAKMKLLNLNSYAQLIESAYSGPLIATNSPVFDVPLVHSKSKQALLNGMLDALKSLLPSSNHVKKLVDSKMGFLIDALCIFDAKGNSIPLDKINPNAIKIAMMVVDFHDVCHGAHRSATGISELSFNLLEKNGYKVLPVPYAEFNTSDKLLKRVQYLEKKLKEIVTCKVSKSN